VRLGRFRELSGSLGAWNTAGGLNYRPKENISCAVWDIRQGSP
jgi:hypothetical protein